MEEKERYEWNSRFDEAIKDNQTGDIVNAVEVLNKQDKRIKELQQQLAENNEFFNAFACKDFNEFKDFISTFMLAPHEEQTLIRELKQQLHDLPKKIVEEIRDVAGDYWDFNICEECGNVPDLNILTMEDFNEILDAILEEFGGEDE